ncbi:hypothetical protein CCHR01_08151 [Colletotrichum chrysophilum]|uniref:Uncharacterized protein n=1 Tax=Colletotrichum chrysophilum TaxID=1836956 RepID=A0AAD9AJP6_9PEZI|nr:hypothetical protein K456DRAFT_931053 [Colletotrichum gloeosporioides 23]KAK1849238.1 hypothetical protein CCHR01_08151 [Colletotrichum chrysophilum]
MKRRSPSGPSRRGGLTTRRLGMGILGCVLHDSGGPRCWELTSIRGQGSEVRGSLDVEPLDKDPDSGGRRRWARPMRQGQFEGSGQVDRCRHVVASWSCLSRKFLGCS